MTNDDVFKIVAGVLLVFSMLVGSLTFANADEYGDFCCVTETQCMGPYEDYGNVGEDVDMEGKEPEEYCLDMTDDPDAFREKACDEIDRCVTGCCVFHDGTRWTQNHDVERGSCPGEDSFFDETVDDRISCEALLHEEKFPIYFNIVDGDGNQIEIDRTESYIQELGEDQRCEFDSSVSDSYNYGVDCDGSGRVGFGTYLVNVIATYDGQTYSKDRNVMVSGEETFEVVLESEEEVETLNITGNVYEYEKDGDDLIPTDKEVVDATVTISGLNVQTETESDGSFVLEDVPVSKDDDGNYLERVISIYAPGFLSWGEHMPISPDNMELEDMEIHLLEDTSSPADQVCCPMILGCSGEEGDGKCFAGSGQGGQMCEGSTALEACDVAAPFCCESEKLCPEGHRSDAGGCRKQACNVPCKETVDCLLDDESSRKVTSVCLCGDEYVDSGYCCRYGEPQHKEDACEDIATEVEGIVLGKSRSADGYVPKEDVTVFFTSEDGTTIRENTDEDGKFTVSLPEGTFITNAYAEGYRSPEQVKRIEIDGQDKELTFIESPFMPDDGSEYESVSKVEEELELGTEISEDEHNLVYNLDYMVESCDWDEGDLSIKSAEASHVPGNNAIQLDWEFDDCLELRNFKIERKATLYSTEDDVLSYDIEDGNVSWTKDDDRSDDDFRTITRQVAARRSYRDTDVEWSSNVPSAEGLPVLASYEGGDDGMVVPGDHEQEMWVYEYRITPVFAGQVGETYDDIGPTRSADSVCEGRSGITSDFCAYDSGRQVTQSDSKYTFDHVLKSDNPQRSAMLRGLRTYEVYCDDDNRLNFADSCYDGEHDLPYMDDYIYSGKVCSGPDSQGSTECKARDICRGEPNPSTRAGGRGAFGMLEPLLSISQSARDDNPCYGEETGDKFANSCVLQPDKTTSDRCVYCEEILDCSDYTSEEACSIDNCMVGYGSDGDTCEWINTSSSSAGEGICVPAEIRPSDNFCGLANRDNVPFESNVGWSDDLCDELGDCFSTFSGGCMDCETEINGLCDNYEDEYQCVGDPGSQQNHSVAYPKPEDYPHGHDDSDWDAVKNTCFDTGEDSDFYNKSNDGCGLGTCAWVGDDCIRDATSTREEDDE
ncbi:MAG: hypothetical protein ACLFSL_04735, partial [Candidatus Woesearchaeota archaeon]